MIDGRLLKPIRPALSLDSTFVQRAFGSGGPNGHLVATFTEVNDSSVLKCLVKNYSPYSILQIGQFTWYYVLTGDLSSPYTLTAKELPPSHSTFPATSLPGPTIAFRYTLDGNISQMVEFGSATNYGPDTELNIAQCGKSDFQYWVIPPFLPFGYTLLGELNKITPVSEQRFSDITVSDNTVMVKVNGVPKEKVPITFYDNKAKRTEVIECNISESGMNVLVLGQQCYGV